MDTLLMFLVGHHLIFYQIFYHIFSCVSMAGPSITSLCLRHLSLGEIFQVMSVLRQLSPAICWRCSLDKEPILFKVPSERLVKAFVKELSRLFRAYAENPAFESILITIKAAFLLIILVIQKHYSQSKSKDHILLIWIIIYNSGVMVLLMNVCMRVVQSKRSWYQRGLTILMRIPLYIHSLL